MFATMQVWFCILLCASLAEEVAGGFMPLGVPSQVELNFLSQSVQNEVTLHVRGRVAIEHFFLKGSIAYAAEMTGKIAGGSHNVTFIGWNNPLKNVVRYLIVDNDCWLS